MNAQQISYMTKLMRRCARRLDDTARELKQSTTIDGRWPDDERDTKREHNALAKDAQRLRHAAEVLQRSLPVKT